MRSLVISGIVLATIGAHSALAGVDPKIAEFCLKAQDFQGCVNSMSGKKPEETTTTVRQVQQQGANLTEGNSCPNGHVYSGGGYCQRVVCVKRGLFGKGHDQYLGGRGMSCDGGKELSWDTTATPIRASIDERCPPKGLEVGYTSTCHQAEDKGYIDLIGFGYDTGKEGIEIVSLYDEPAKSSGLAVGDKIVSRHLRGLSDTETSQKIKQGIEIGDVMVLVVERNGRKREFLLNAAPNRFPLRKE